ncbi:toxin Cry1Ac domain D-VI-related protein [Pediococcus acidilactici]|uniref:toxin Cry1Ac domain D-VI-related protein n=1 Tax=Pediococcus acidilactici TaxID=1254 RepID=UPI001951C583|nr:toxin Cry1Ac domain D-VI-related protein [Pediococcus acidilactici]MBM6585955.1 hypothetical protein [Pediococcus acidilactici]
MNSRKYTKYTMVAITALTLGLTAGTVAIHAATRMPTQNKTADNSNSTIQRAVKVVNALFADRDYTQLAKSTTMERISTARQLVTLNVPANSSTFNKLNVLCDKATTLLERQTVNTAVKKATATVDALFADKNHTTLAPTTTAGRIQRAEDLSTATDVPVAKQRELLALCHKATDLLNQQENTSPAIQRAIKVVNGLFTDNTHSRLASTITAERIATAKQLVALNVPANSNTFNELNSLCDQAEILLNSQTANAGVKKATAAINALFADTNHTRLAANTTKERIQAAKMLLQRKVPASDAHYAQLRALCQKAEQLLQN